MKNIILPFLYLKYLVKSTNKKGVHSPFVNSLLENVINVPHPYYAFNEIEKIREQLLDSTEKITITDYGAGGQKNINQEKKISSIALHSAKNTKYAQLLFRLVQYFKPNTILELGTSLGLTTMYLSKANIKSKIYTIEGCKSVASIAQQNFNVINTKNIELINNTFDRALPSILNTIDTLDFVFFDGNHRKDATLNYFKTCLPLTNENSIFVFDDINWSNEMREAWNEIKLNNNVTLTIDLFFLGIVFFKKVNTKQHFIIRY